MSDVSEAEVEAAAKVLSIAETEFRGRRRSIGYYTSVGIDHFNHASGLADHMALTGALYKAAARAALTAAAQVRAQEGAGAENRIASPAQEAEFASYVESVARALHEAHMPYCDYTYPFDDPMSSSDMYRELARAVTLVRAGGGVQ